MIITIGTEKSFDDIQVIYDINKNSRQTRKASPI